MILKLLVSGVVLFGAFFAGQTVSGPQDADPKKPPSQEDMAKLMLAMQEAGKPGEQHKSLAAMAGKWTQKVTMTMPGAPKQESAGTSEYKSILGGRFVTQEMSGQMMGMPFNGFQVMGYDNVTKKYQSCWIDSMGTGMFMSEGTASPDGKSVTYQGVMKDFMTPNGRPWKMAVTTESADAHKVEMWDTIDGKLVQIMTINETRAK